MREKNSVALTALALVLLLVLACTVPAPGYSVVPGHPRLYLLSSQVDDLRAKCEGPLAGDLADIVAWAEENKNAPLPIANDWQYGCHLASYSFLYLATGDVSYAGRAKALAQYGMDHGSRGEGHYTCGLALFFDWCNDYLTPAERQNFGWELGESGLAYAAQHDYDTMNNYHSKLSRLKPLAFAGIPLHGEGIHDSAAATLCDLFREHTFGERHTLACMDEIAGDGSYFEGEYTLNILANYFVPGCWVWNVATGESAFEVSSNLSHMSEYYLYEIFAKNGPGVNAFFGGSKQGDSYSHTTGAASARLFMHTLAKAYGDGRAEWLAREIDARELGYINRNERWQLIVMRDMDVVPVPPYDLPYTRYFEDMGTVYMRSGWDYSENSTDTYAVFRCEGMNAGHTHAHQNHLLIARGGDVLAIDSGGYDSSISEHHSNYFERTIAHNTVTVYDPDETSFEPFANDGGQLPPGRLPIQYGDASDDRYYRGKVVGVRETEDHVEMKGDATAAYSPHKMEFFTREIIHRKPDVFVVFDRVRATSPSFEKRWLLHSIGEPSIEGDTVLITQGASRLVVRSVLPAGASVSKVGGPGREFEVEGVNYVPTENLRDDMGSWRIEITPPDAAREHLFLTVLVIGAAAEASLPDVSFYEDENVVGVVVNGWKATFNISEVAMGAGTTFQYDD
jgi:hypothetical protein